ncbi:MAG: AAA family ATPase [Rubrivivax sp.]
MYAPHFGLQQEAFAIAPDPRFLHLSAMHREALAHLMYGLQGGGGFVLLTGEIGTGKTTLARCFLEQIPAGHRVAYVVNPRLTPLELLQTVCEEFGIERPQPQPGELTKPLVDAINRFLLQAHAQGEQCLLVVDEAQALSTRLLEMLRLLTNLETSERKLLQIVLIGQPELRDKLARPELRQLAQRVIARVHLGPLSRDEVAAYVAHRLSVAGRSGPLPFDRRALAAVHRASGGIPRRINLLCQRALLGAYALGRDHVDARIVHQAAREVFDDAPRAPWRRGWPLAGAMAIGVAGVGAVAWQQLGRTDAPAPMGTPASAPTMAMGAASASPAAPAAASAPPSATLPPGPRDAWAALAADWGLPAEARQCQDAAALGLACHEGQADLALLRRLDRPLLLHTGEGALLLRALGGDEARVLGADGERRVRVATLLQAWDGRYSTWWRPPPGWPSAGAVAPWVLQRLTTLQGDARGQAARSRDEQLRARVFAFQVAQELPLDGVAGPLTLMQLNRASGVDEPRLRSEP